MPLLLLLLGPKLVEGVIGLHPQGHQGEGVTAQNLFHSKRIPQMETRRIPSQSSQKMQNPTAGDGSVGRKRGDGKMEFIWQIAHGQEGLSGIKQADAFTPPY